MSISQKSVKNLKNQFVDEEVIIYLKNMNVVTVNPNGEEMSVSPMIQGYIIDIDEDFLHMGLEDGTIIRSIPHENAGMIELLVPEDPMLAVDFPYSDEDVH